MADHIGSIAAKFTADTSGFLKGVRQVESAMNSGAGKVIADADKMASSTVQAANRMAGSMSGMKPPKLPGVDTSGMVKDAQQAAKQVGQAMQGPTLTRQAIFDAGTATADAQKAASAMAGIKPPKLPGVDTSGMVKSAEQAAQQVSRAFERFGKAAGIDPAKLVGLDPAGLADLSRQAGADAAKQVAQAMARVQTLAGQVNLDPAKLVKLDEAGLGKLAGKAGADTAGEVRKALDDLKNLSGTVGIDLSRLVKMSPGDAAKQARSHVQDLAEQVNKELGQAEKATRPGKGPAAAPGQPATTPAGKAPDATKGLATAAGKTVDDAIKALRLGNNKFVEVAGEVTPAFEKQAKRLASAIKADNADLAKWAAERGKALVKMKDGEMLVLKYLGDGRSTYVAANKAKGPLGNSVLQKEMKDAEAREKQLDEMAKKRKKRQEERNKWLDDADKRKIERFRMGLDYTLRAGSAIAKGPTLPKSDALASLARPTDGPAGHSIAPLLKLPGEIASASSDLAGSITGATSAIGGAIGSFLGPIGTLVGSGVGGLIGAQLTLPFRVLAGVLGPLGTAASTAFGIVQQGSAGLIAADTQARNLGLSVNELRTYMLAAGPASDAMADALGNVTTKLAAAQAGSIDARRDFARLSTLSGMRLDLDRLTGGTAPRTAIEALSRIRDGGTRAATAFDIFGARATEILPLLDKGAAGIDEAAKKMERFGLAVSPKEIGVMREVDAAMRNFDALKSGAFNQIAIGLSPIVAELASLVDLSKVDISTWKNTVIDAMHGVSLGVGTMIAVWQDTSLISDAWDVVMLKIEAGFAKLLAGMQEEWAKTLRSFGFDDWAKRVEGEAQLWKGDADNLDRLAGAKGDALKQKWAESPAIKGVNEFFGRVRDRIKPDAPPGGGGAPPKPPPIPSHILKMTQQYDQMLQATKSPLDKFKDDMAQIKDMGKFGKFAGPGGDLLRARFSAKAFGDLSSAMPLPAYQATGAAMAGTREAYSAILQAQNQEKRSSVQEQMKAILEQARAIEEEQLKTAKAQEQLLAMINEKFGGVRRG